MGDHVHLPISVPGPHLTWTWAGPVQAVTVSESSHEHQSCVPEGVVSLFVCFTFSLVLTLFLTPPQSSLSPEGRSFLETSQSGLGIPRSLTLRHPVLGLCICFHLLQVEDSLMMVE